MRFLERAWLSCTLLVSTLVTVTNGALPEFAVSDRELEIAGGYYSGSGKYLGGIPKVKSSDFFYTECTKFHYPTTTSSANSSASDGVGGAVANNVSVCTEWNANRYEVLSNGDQVDLCYCTGIVTGHRYCGEWSCDRKEVTDAELCESDSEWAGSRRLQSCYTEIAAGATKCACDDEENELDYCPSWACEIYLGATVYESSTCARVADSGLYCEAWTSEMEGSDQVTTAACECTEASIGGGGTCAASRCKQRYIDACGVCDLAISIAAWGIVGLCGILLLLQRCFNQDRFSPCVFLTLLLICGAGAGVGLYGGQDGGMYVGIMWVAGIASYMCCCRPPKDN